jgi:hypothetical protein
MTTSSSGKVAVYGSIGFSKGKAVWEFKYEKLSFLVYWL